MSGPNPIDPGALHEVLANIDLGTARWRRKARLIGIVARWGEVHELALLELANRGRSNHELTSELLGELILQRIVVPVYVGAGGRPSAYYVSDEIEKWLDVPWERDVDAVVRWAFHVEHEPYVEPVPRAVRAANAARERTRRAGRSAPAARGVTRRAESGPRPARGDSPARGIRAAVRAPLRVVDVGEREPGSAEPGTNDPPPLLSPEEQEERDRIEASYRKIRSLVAYAAAEAIPGRKNFVGGRADAELREVFAELGAERIKELVRQADPSFGVPKLIRWLADQSAGVDPELAAALDARAEPDPLAGMFGAPAEPAAPRLPEWKPGDDARVLELTPEERKANVERARAGLRSNEHQEVAEA